MFNRHPACVAAVFLCALFAGQALAAGPFSIKAVVDPALKKELAAFGEFMRQGDSNSFKVKVGQLHYRGKPLHRVSQPISREAGGALLKAEYDAAAEYLSESDGDVGDEAGRSTHRWLRSTSDDYATGSEEPDSDELQKQNRATLARLFKNAATMKGWGISQTDSGLTVSATLLVDHNTGRTIYVELLQFP